MDYLSAGSPYIDVLCILEPWIHSPEHLSGLQIQGYTEILSLRSSDYLARPYGGLVIYIRSAIYAEVNVLQTNMGTRHDVIWLRLRGVTWCFLYWPPSTSSHLRDWDSDVIDTLAGDLAIYGPPHVVIGDFNAHVFNTVNSRGRHLTTLSESFGMSCLNNGSPTYYHAGTSTTIDLAFASDVLLPRLKFMVGDVSPESLHCPIHLLYNSTGMPISEPYIALRHPRPPPPTNPSRADGRQQRLLDMVTRSCRGVEGIDYPRLEECLTMSTVRRRLRRLGKRRLTPNTSIEIAMLRLEWKLWSKVKLKKRRQEAKRKMWELRGRKGYWNHINSTRKKTASIALRPLHVEKHFRQLLGSNLAPGLFTAGKSVEDVETFLLDLNLPPMEPEPLSKEEVRAWYDLKEPNSVVGGIADDELLSSPITSLEISFALAKLKDSAEGEDAVKISELKSVAANDIASFFCELMDDHEIPTCWHRAVLVPIPKKGTPKTPSELRGIAIQPALRRLFAACMARRMHKWCDLNNILPPCQSGFRPNFRTTENIFILRCLMERAYHEKVNLIAVSVDIEKAFDKVNRHLLWNKLERWGAVGPLIDLVKLMYTDPMVTLKMNSKYSDFMPSSNGVLQGCPLSPLLFICYLADIPLTSWFDPLLNGKRVLGLMLADDLLILSTSVAGAEAKLANVEEFLGLHSMRLNPAKSWAMNLTFNRGVDPEVWCGDVRIPMGCEELYNGWMLEAYPRRGPWQSLRHNTFRHRHSLSVAQSLMSLTKPLSIPITVLSTGLYRNLVEPELIYACESSFDCTRSVRQQLNRLQLKFLRFCLGLPSYAVGELVLWDCGQLSLSDRRLQLTSRFFAHAASLGANRLAYHALRDSLDMSVTSNKGWLCSLAGFLKNIIALPDVNDVDACGTFPARLDAELKRIQWEELSRVVISSATLRSLSWARPTRGLKKALYLRLPKFLARAIARLRFGANNLAIHCSAWENIELEDRLCDACREVETESHTLGVCDLFAPERARYLMELSEIDGVGLDCMAWQMDSFMRSLLVPGNIEIARAAGHFLRTVWKEVDERYVS